MRRSTDGAFGGAAWMVSSRLWGELVREAQAGSLNCQLTIDKKCNEIRVIGLRQLSFRNALTQYSLTGPQDSGQFAEINKSGSILRLSP